QEPAQPIIKTPTPEMENTTRTFKKSKVDVKTHYLELVYEEISNSGEEVYVTEHAVKFSREVHADMVQAMNNLIPHMLVLTELADATEFAGIDPLAFDRDTMHFSRYDVSSVSTGGEDEHFGLTISGRKTLRNGRVFNINTPFVKLEGGEHEEKYALARDLSLAYDLLVKEVELFIDTGKAAPKKQLELELNAA